MTSEFDEIYSRFLLKITDYNILNFDEQLLRSIEAGWLRSALSKPYIRRLFSSCEIDEDVEEISYELKFQTTYDEDKDFVDEVIAKGMVIEWLTPTLESVLNIQQIFTSDKTKYYSQANHLSELKDLYIKTKNDLRKMIRDRGYIYNSYLLS